MLPALEPLLGEESTDALGQLVQCLAGAEIARFVLAQTGDATWAELHPNGLAGFLKKAQVPAVLILHISLEQVDHLLDVVEVPGKSGGFDSFKP
ncbi:hypothetical protein D9M68_641900 [compost metagenome]